MRHSSVSPKRVALAAVATAAFLLGSAAGHAAPKSIVGEWVEQPQDCGTQFAWAVGPKSLSNDSLVCEFATVEREGARVTFRGECNDGNGMAAETVVADERGGKLRITFAGTGGGTLGPLSHCGRR